MNATNMRSLPQQYAKSNSVNFYEMFIAIYVFLGVFMANDTINTVRYVFSIIIQILLLFRFVFGQSINYRHFVKYFLTIFLIFVIMVDFILMGTEMGRVVNRIGPLISVFGIILAGDKSFRINLKKVLSLFLSLYVLLAFVINVDALVFKITNNAIWPPMIYLGNRFAGPFGDPNFMALYSSCALIIAFTLPMKKGRRVFFILILLINIILSEALTTFILLPVTYMFHKVFKPKNLLKKQIMILIGYGVLFAIYFIFRKQIEAFAIEILKLLYGSAENANIKLISLQYRLDTQMKALKIFYQNIFGLGPLQIVPQLGHDTHNSYIGIMFEEGIVGLILILFTIRRGKCTNSSVNYMSTYLMLSALLLNVHYTSIYSFFLLIQYLDGNRSDNGIKQNLQLQRR